jgi:hypothetical protein
LSYAGNDVVTEKFRESDGSWPAFKEQTHPDSANREV